MSAADDFGLNIFRCLVMICDLWMFL